MADEQAKRTCLVARNEDTVGSVGTLHDRNQFPSCEWLDRMRSEAFHAMRAMTGEHRCEVLHYGQRVTAVVVVVVVDAAFQYLDQKMGTRSGGAQIGRSQTRRRRRQMVEKAVMKERQDRCCLRRRELMTQSHWKAKKVQSRRSPTDEERCRRTLMNLRCSIQNRS